MENLHIADMRTNMYTHHQVKNKLSDTKWVTLILIMCPLVLQGPYTCEHMQFNAISRLFLIGIQNYFQLE